MINLINKIKKENTEHTQMSISIDKLLLKEFKSYCKLYKLKQSQVISSLIKFLFDNTIK